MILRKGRAEDIAAVLEIVRAVVPLMRAAGNLQWDDVYPNAEVLTGDVDRGELWVAEVDGRIAGMAAITTDQSPEYAEVGWDLAVLAVVPHRLAVDPSVHGRGIAAALMLKAEEVARELGITRLRVDTNTHNLATQRLFPKLGYVYAGEISLDFREGMRFLCYEKTVLPDGVLEFQP